MSKSEEYLNLDRYVDEKIFTKVSGKSLFKDYETILQEYRKKRWEEQEIIRKAEEAKREVEERKRLEELGKKKANKVTAKKQQAQNVAMEKHKSERPPLGKTPKLEEGEGKLKHAPTQVTTFRTGAAQPPQNFENNDTVKVDKVVIKPVDKVAAAPVDKIVVKPVNKADGVNIPLGTSIIEVQNDNDSDSPKDDNAPLLLERHPSDIEDDYSNSYDINGSQKEESKLAAPSNKTESNKEYDEILQMDDQRKESMYDVMMKKEESVKSAKSSIGTSRVGDKSISEEGYDADRSRLNSNDPSAKNSMNTGVNSTFSRPPKTYVGEPVTQTSCFGSCWNWVLSVFKRN
jgi:hypothetical protein